MTFEAWWNSSAGVVGAGVSIRVHVDTGVPISFAGEMGDSPSSGQWPTRSDPGIDTWELHTTFSTTGDKSVVVTAGEPKIDEKTVTITIRPYVEPPPPPPPPPPIARLGTPMTRPDLVLVGWDEKKPDDSFTTQAIAFHEDCS